MKASTRIRDIGAGSGGNFSSRRRNGNTLSISSLDHHVTEAIGDMYGDDEYNSSGESRPLSFVHGPESNTIEEADQHFMQHPRSPSLRMANNAGSQLNINGHAGSRSPVMSNNREYSSSPPSPVLSVRDNASLSPNETAHAQFPLSNVDYESSPAAVAQELSNLQALRRMSMDVGSASDPDLPSFQGASLMPAVAPTGSDDEHDPSRLFWVPARVHPELAPMEFKTFLENRVNAIKRRSGDSSLMSEGGLERSGSTSSTFSTGGGLQRKKSMLSRQIDNSGGRAAAGYQDGADRLVRKKSQSAHRSLDLKISDLKELDALVRDPTKAMKSLSLDTTDRIQQAGVDVAEQSEDLPILPAAPGRMGLQRSTRTQYRRGGTIRRGERPKRVGNRVGAILGDTDNEDSPSSPASANNPVSSPFGSSLTKVASEPTPENFSRPNRSARREGNSAGPALGESTSGDLHGSFDGALPPSSLSPISRQISLPTDMPASSMQRNETPVPQIIETPPLDEHSENLRGSKPHQQSNQAQFPQRTSSSKASEQVSSLQPHSSQPQSVSTPTSSSAPMREPPMRSSNRPVPNLQDSSTSNSHKASTKHTFEQMSQHPTPLPGSNARTDSLTFIPTFEEKKSDKKKHEKEDSGTRKTSWGWFKGSDDKDKKDKKKDENRDESKRSKSKTSLDKTHENSRLDVLQNSIDGASVRGRESLLLERESIDNKLVEERKKESSRKSGDKKEKDGLFSSIFGGKKKSDRDSGPKKGSSLRTLSPETPRRIMKPDMDYPWTRFTILEERAIYRMAHIKLANPKRALHSQVLLSNFMYSYLAKVQQMHPQVQAPANVQQKQMEAERRQKEQEQQQQKQQQQQYDYQSSSSHDEQAQQQQPEGVTYVDDSQIYNYDHQNDEAVSRNASERPSSRQAQHNNSNSAGPGHGNSEQHEQLGYYHQTQAGGEGDDDDNEDMW